MTILRQIILFNSEKKHDWGKQHARELKIISGVKKTKWFILEHVK